MRSRFVQPETTILTLGNGDTLVVRKRLNVGEQRESYRACTTLVEEVDASGDPTTKRVPDPYLIGRAKVAAYLVDWHLAGDDESVRGLDFAQRLAILDNLDPEDFYEIKDAVDAHELAMIAARLAEKKILNTPTSDAPTSDSPSVAVGASSGSAS
jgi:hypothetical protein